MKRPVSSWTVENMWVCTSCRKQNLGRHTECQYCGSPKEKEEQDIDASPATAAKVEDPELLRLASQGPNWVCEFCGGQVRNEHGKCVKNCGAPKPALPPDPQVVAVPILPVDSAAEARIEQQLRQRPPPTTVPGPGRRRPPDAFPWWLVVGGTLALGGFISLLVFLLRTREVEAKVTSIQWLYTADLKFREVNHGTGWSHPSGAYNITTDSRKTGTKDCNPHQCNPHTVQYQCNCTDYDCDCEDVCTKNGNGFSTCQKMCDVCQRCDSCDRTEYETCHDKCDVYADWYEYDYDKWPTLTKLATGGTKHDEHWADLRAEGPDQRLDKTQEFTVMFADEKDSWKLSPQSEDDFKHYETGVVWRIAVNRLGMVTPLQPLKGSP